MCDNFVDAMVEAQEKVPLRPGSPTRVSSPPLFLAALLLLAGCRGNVMEQDFHLQTGTWQSQVVEVTARSKVTATVVETMGRDFAFRLLSNGRQVFASGVQSGKAEGTVVVEPGRVSVLVMDESNGDERIGHVSIRVEPVATR